MGKPLQALIVEDSEDDALLTVHELRQGGYEPQYVRVETAEALRASLDAQSWDVILSDYVMPHFNGLDALEVLHEKGLDLPFIIISGRIGEETAVQAMKAGAHDYLLKGNLARLAAAIERELRDAEGRHQHRLAQARIVQLNRVLRAIRTVNQLIVREKDRDTLLEGVCKNLVSARGYYNVWIALLDEADTSVIAAEDGMAKEDFLALLGHLRRGQLPNCARKALSTPEVLTIEETVVSCADCPLAHICRKRAGMTCRLESAGVTYGVIVVCVELDYVIDEEEQSLFEEVAGDIAFALRNMELERRREQAEEDVRQGLLRLRSNLEETVNALASVVEQRDPYTAGHEERVAELACAIAEELGLPGEQINGIHLAGVIHDIGKMAVPAEILTKPTRLTEAEFSMIKGHSQVGYDVLKDIRFPWPIARIVLQHHERTDGSGYPLSIGGEEILLEARILGVADVVEAMASHRPYRPALGIDKALEEISEKKGLLYDTQVVDACLTLFTEKRFALK